MAQEVTQDAERAAYTIVLYGFMLRNRCWVGYQNSMIAANAFEKFFLDFGHCAGAFFGAARHHSS